MLAVSKAKIGMYSFIFIYMQYISIRTDTYARTMHSSSTHVTWNIKGFLSFDSQQFTNTIAACVNGKSS